MKKTILIVLVKLFFCNNVCTQNNLFHFSPNYGRYLAAKNSSTKQAFFFKAKTNEKIVCISFDDGPSRYTKELIKLLNDKECPAIFFISGHNITERKNLMPLYKNSLFEIGCHGFYHHDYTKILDVADWEKPPEQKVLNDINNLLSNGDIILLHEAIDLKLLEKIIDLIRKNGFEIVGLSKIIKYQNIVP